MSRDLRAALRAIRRTPMLTGVAVVTLALAIGVNTAIFSVVNQLLIRPLVYSHADRLVVIDATKQVAGVPRPRPVSWPLDAADRWRDGLRSFSDVTYYATSVFQLSTPDGAELLEGASVAPSFFSTLGGPIVAGRPIADAHALTPSLVISDRLARRMFGRASAALDAHLVLNATAYTVIGVAGPDWDVPSVNTDVWESAPMARLRNGRCCSVQILGRLRPGVTIGQARGDVTSVAAALGHVDPDAFGGVRATLATLRDRQLGDARTALLLLWAAVALVLVVACANVANLLVARNLIRAREFAIRRALGASRGQLVAQGMIDALILAAAGVAGGLLVAWGTLAALLRFGEQAFPRLPQNGLDFAVLAFAAGLGALTTLATGLVPSLQAANAAPPRTTAAVAAASHRRLRQLLCVAQLAAAAVLLVSATLLGRSLVDLLRTDLGVAPDHVVTASINTAFGRPHSAREIAGTMQQVVDRVRSMPGVIAAGAGTSLPPNQGRLVMSLRRQGSDVDYMASAVSCTPGYFQALSIRLVNGRLFAASDDARHAPVIIVSETTARHLFGDLDPIGRTLGIPKFQYRLAAGTDATVVGVVSDVKYSGIDTPAGDQVYWSLAQAPWLSTFLTVRTAGEVSVAPQLRAVVASVDPTVAVSSIAPLDGIIATATAPARFRTAVIAAFALVGLAIAAIGLYGIVSCSVSQRTAEIGVRVALGAATRDVLSLVLREGAAVAAAGVAIGLPAAYWASRGFATLLFGIQRTDPITYATAAAGLLAAALAATLVPARRAARVDPIVALRAE